MDFVVSDSGLNRYGFRVLTMGILLENFLANPIMFYVHETNKIPIGTWSNLRIEGDKLIATANFDEEDDFAMKIKAKCEKGILKATSIGFDVIEYSEAARLLLKGQKRPTIVKCDLLEISIVGVPANPRAIRLSNQGFDDQLPYLNLTTNMDLEKIVKQLDLPSSATEEQVLAAVANLRQGQVEAALNVGERKGIVTDTNREGYRTALTLNFAATKLTFDLAPEKDVVATVAVTNTASPQNTIASQLRAAAVNGGMVNERDTWTFDDWQKKDKNALSVMRTKEPAKYQALAEVYYNDKKGFN